ncbi:MAG TPA: ABC transporter ATP-binding protein [Thermoleophilaceae bacterium]|nr:ABC transporter ATP-binding protein [Thermoleophilaceae bacterium]
MPATVQQSAARRQRDGSSAPPAVSVEGVSKRFRLPHEQYSTLKQRVLHPRRSRTFSELRALEDVSFDIAPGEFFGIVGRNGSGKSTLLKCLAGIYGVDSGRINVRGRLSPFIELGVGFHPELSARDNVTINAVMLGLTRKQALERFDEIIAFAELEEFVDLKLKNYSSGMSVRLGFAVSIQVNADVLLVDEVLAVGDAAFQQKCFDEFYRLKDEGRTIVFVTHGMDAVRRFCDRAMLLDHGEMIDIGEPDAIAAKYAEVNFGKVADGGPSSAPGVPRVRIKRVWCTTAGRPAPEVGDDTVAVTQGEDCVACMEVEFSDAVEDPIFSINFRNDVRHTIYVARSDRGMAPSGKFNAGERVSVEFRFPNWLAGSIYTLTPAVVTGDGRMTLDQREDAVTLHVKTQGATGGVADLPTAIEVKRS